MVHNSKAKFNLLVLSAGFFFFFKFVKRDFFFFIGNRSIYWERDRDSGNNNECLQGIQ